MYHKQPVAQRAHRALGRTKIFTPFDDNWVDGILTFGTPTIQKRFPLVTTGENFGGTIFLVPWATAHPSLHHFKQREPISISYGENSI